MLIKRIIAKRNLYETTIRHEKDSFVTARCSVAYGYGTDRRHRRLPEELRFRQRIPPHCRTDHEGGQGDQSHHGMDGRLHRRLHHHGHLPVRLCRNIQRRRSAGPGLPRQRGRRTGTVHGLGRRDDLQPGRHPACRHLHHQRSHLQRQERHERQVAAGVDSAERHCRHLHARLAIRQRRTQVPAVRPTCSSTTCRFWYRAWTTARPD